ncbi:ribonuclease H-like domain-containing protein [Tanacetum coccineum]|uniref:Ribonuclease H-like domain-containing protein n=1 Tax=Tanacetum coccineum TaxID=301880 RepID=A0ABQ5D4Q1_9ASTR
MVQLKYLLDQRVTTTFQAKWLPKLLGDWPSSAKAEGSLTARPTRRAGTKVGLTHIDGKVWHLDVGSSPPGAVVCSKGWAVRPLKRPPQDECSPIPTSPEPPVAQPRQRRVLCPCGEGDVSHMGELPVCDKDGQLIAVLEGILDRRLGKVNSKPEFDADAAYDPSSSTVLINNLEAGNPLHVQNSDNSSSVLIPFKLLSTKNYKIWCGAMKLALLARNKYDFVDDVYMGLVYSENAASVCKELQKNYFNVDGFVVYNLLQKTNLPKCTCDVKCSCDASKELLLHQQLMKMMQFLMGLDDYYRPVRSAFLTRDPLPKLKDAYNTVSREESRRGIPMLLRLPMQKQVDGNIELLLLGLLWRVRLMYRYAAPSDTHMFVVHIEHGETMKQGKAKIPRLRNPRLETIDTKMKYEMKEPLGVALKKDNAIVQYPRSIPGEHVYLANTEGFAKFIGDSKSGKIVAVQINYQDAERTRTEHGSLHP